MYVFMYYILADLIVTMKVRIYPRLHVCFYAQNDYQVYFIMQYLIKEKYFFLS
jgi:hypothetical protein